mgnify:CR=1 FL=1
MKESQAPSGASDGSGGKAVDAFYEVVACVNHTGTLSKGHYTAHVKEGGLWFNADDMYIEHLSEDDVVVPQPRGRLPREGGARGRREDLNVRRAEDGVQISIAAKGGMEDRQRHRRLTAGGCRRCLAAAACGA